MNKHKSRSTKSLLSRMLHIIKDLGQQSVPEEFNKHCSKLSK